MKPAKVLLFILLIIVIQSARAQYFFAYRDTLGILYTYDNGYIRRMEDRYVKNFKFGTTAAAFVTQMDEFKISYSSGSMMIQNNLPTAYNFSRSLLVYEFSSNLNVYWNGQNTKLAAFFNGYGYGDSIVAFYDRVNVFKIFFNGEVYDVNPIAVQDYAVSRNIVAYNDHASLFKVFYHGKLKTLEKYKVDDYQVGSSTVAWLDQTGKLRAYCDRRVFDLEEVTPNFYNVSDNMVIYQSKDKAFKVFYKDSVYQLETFLPKQWWFTDALVYYIDENNRLKVFDQGKKIIIEQFQPKVIKVFNRTLAYLDIYKNLIVYKNGETKNVSGESVNDFWINGDLIVYHAQINEIVFIGKDGPFRMKMNWQKF